MENYGLIIKDLKPQDWRFGSVTALKSQVYQEDRNWDDFLPQDEFQAQSLSCVTFSALNCLEMMALRKYGLKFNWSDRFIAKASGTSMMGNSLAAVADTIVLTGLVNEVDYPYDYANFSWKSYYTDIPMYLFDQAAEFKKEYDIDYEWVTIKTPEALWDALKYSPLQVTGSYPKFIGDEIIKRVDAPYNHAFTVYGGEYGKYFKVFDHFSDNTKKIAWDYDLSTFAMRYDITKLSEIMDKPIIKNNTLVQLVEGVGGFGFYLDDKIIIDDLAKILATDRMRNKEQNTIALKQVEWDMFDKVNLKGEQV